MKGKAYDLSVWKVNLFTSGSDWDSGSDSSDSDSDVVTQPLSQRRCDSEQPLFKNQCDSEHKWSMNPSTAAITNRKYYEHNWSKEEHITLLKDLIEFESHQEKLNVRLDPSIFEQYMHKKLNLESVDINGEIRRLNAKFWADMERKPADNDDGVVFQLSRKLWGLQYYMYQRVKNPLTYPGEAHLRVKYPILGATFHNYYLLLIQRNIKLIPEKQLSGLDEKLKNVQDEEARKRIVRDSYKWLRELDKKGKST